jgi:DNA (cytosine-5)-methyltransferase 1
MKPTAIDLFCGAGGATLGLQRAGYHVTGVDIKRQPRYCGDAFIQADVLSLGPLSGYDLIWASPPCQFGTALRHAHNAKKDHANLIPPTRELLKASGLPYVIENVEPVAKAHLINPFILCGSMFGLQAAGHQLQRHRGFETNFLVLGQDCRHWSPVVGLYGGHVRCRAQSQGGRLTRDFVGQDKRAIATTAMELEETSMTMLEMSQAIPPAYSEYIGRFALKLRAERIGE